MHGAGELSAVLRLTTEAAARAGAEADPLRTGVASMNAATRSGAAGAYPECVRALGGTDFAALGRRYLDHLRALAPGAARVTDKLPGNYLHLGFIATILPGATIVHCRRDPLDNAISLYFTDFMVGHEYSNDLRTIGRQIRGMRALMAHWEAVLGDRLLTLDYEALVADPEPLTRRMVAHVGLEWDDACLRPHEVARTVRTASAWQVRQPVYRRSAGTGAGLRAVSGPVARGAGRAGAGRMTPPLSRAAAGSRDDVVRCGRLRPAPCRRRGAAPRRMNVGKAPADAGRKKKPLPGREGASSHQSGLPRETFETCGALS